MRTGWERRGRRGVLTDKCLLDRLAWSSGVGRGASTLKQPAIVSRTSRLRMLLRGLIETGPSAPEHSQTQALIPRVGKGAGRGSCPARLWGCDGDRTEKILSSGGQRGKTGQPMPPL